ncbi:MAG: GntR family transcriptional regulator [Alphaproteobacteria bacterium]|nr:GntR family transcriptional regulator [Alphaproteobacteria bacterium]
MLRDKAYARFKQRLFAGTLRPGQFVSQRELADTIGLPIAPVRDALKRLQAEALVRIIPQRGIQIADVNAKLIRDAYELRSTLEIHAVRRFVERGDFEALAALDAQMRSIAARATTRLTDALASEFVRLDFRMHETLIDALDNELIADVYRVNVDRILLMRLVNRLTRERLLAATEEHMAIIDALKRRDGDAAAAAMARHLAAAFQKMMGVA